MVLALADGATCLSDLAAFRAQPTMFGPAPSEATVWRPFDQVGPVELRGIATAQAAARERASPGTGPATDEEGLLDEMQASGPHSEAGLGPAPRSIGIASNATSGTT